MKKAFTLIELLVVIAIIAILAAILFPVFAQAKLAAKKSAALSNVKQISLANMQYWADNEDKAPPRWYNPRGDGSYATAMENVNPYAKNKDIWINPGSQSMAPTTWNTTATNPDLQVVAHYMFTPFANPYNYYNWSGTVMWAGWAIDANETNATTTCSATSLGATGACVGAPMVDNPANSIYVMPGYMLSYKPKVGFVGADLVFGSAATIGFNTNPEDAVGKNYFPFNKGNNYGFSDGHAKYVTGKQMNSDASASKSYGGNNYPASPFMMVRS